MPKKFSLIDKATRQVKAIDLSFTNTSQLKEDDKHEVLSQEISDGEALDIIYVERKKRYPLAEEFFDAYYHKHVNKNEVPMSKYLKKVSEVKKSIPSPYDLTPKETKHELKLRTGVLWKLKTILMHGLLFMRKLFETTALYFSRKG